ncbi:iron complex transport system ATP-binding protein [Ruegeria halocynthiae]|uniref:Iron complex transport system ATP-binding protein n=1 Tax=Ruegeria halocynthiae TaxID=985054 RepID=A0A1H2XXQ9_9RHOB|nr:heme ABC transporter ATP-binding protein [Ruegeria halocynthiae]SDW97204.1 iron complex transport system ATP-binding protein [Ruegeria halocynthiae]
MLIANQVSVRLGRRTILLDLSFNALAGQVTAVVGPSGAGKSTLLAALTGDIEYAGTVTLCQRDLAQASVAELAEMRAVLPQATPISFPFTVLEVVRMGRLRRASDDRAASEALSQVGLRGFEGRYYQELSGGEQQRVQLARVLVQVWEPVGPVGPRWLFLDEPVSSLDIGHQLQVMRIIQNFAGAGGGVMMVMHDLNLTAMCADSVILMADGALVHQGTPQETLRDQLLSTAYGCRIAVNRAPNTGVFLLPQVATVLD